MDDPIKYPETPERLVRPEMSEAEIFAAELVRLTRSRDAWITRAYLAENENIRLQQIIEQLEARLRIAKREKVALTLLAVKP